MRKLLAVATLLALSGSLGATALLSASVPSFAPARSYATGRSPNSVGIGDLNGDGKPDLATANSRANTVSVLLNRGDGRFQARRDYGAGGASSVAIGDLNGDGKPDLVTTVSVLLNRGDGSFQAKRDYANAGASSVALGDLNGDGKPDLVTAIGGACVACARSGVSVLLNRGDSSFEPNVDYPTDDFGSDSVAIGDLNADGAPDLATANDFGYSVSVLLNRGDGSFRPKRDFEYGSRPRSVAIGDLNGDGKLDLATADRGRYHDWVSVLLNRGDGSVRAQRAYYASYSESESVAIGDLNGDGRPDLATAVDRISVLVNRGDGRFRAKIDYPTGGFPQSVAIGDLNGDGKADLTAANSVSNTVSVLLNTPGLCTVQDVFRQTLLAAKRTIARANCRVGKIRRAYSRVKRGHVISQNPRFGAVLRGASKVNLVVSRGRRPS